MGAKNEKNDFGLIFDQIGNRFDDMKKSVTSQIDELKSALKENMDKIDGAHEKNEAKIDLVRKDFDTYIAVQEQKDKEQTAWKEKLEKEILPGMSNRIDDNKGAWKVNLGLLGTALVVVLAIIEIARVIWKF